VYSGVLLFFVVAPWVVDEGCGTPLRLALTSAIKHPQLLVFPPTKLVLVVTFSFPHWQMQRHNLDLTTPADTPHVSRAVNLPKLRPVRSSIFMPYCSTYHDLQGKVLTLQECVKAIKP
jgi:hypothetical protein